MLEWSNPLPRPVLLMLLLQFWSCVLRSHPVGGLRNSPYLTYKPGFCDWLVVLHKKWAGFILTLRDVVDYSRNWTDCKPGPTNNDDNTLSKLVALRCLQVNLHHGWWLLAVNCYVSPGEMSALVVLIGCLHKEFTQSKETKKAVLATAQIRTLSGCDDCRRLLWICNNNGAVIGRHTFWGSSRLSSLARLIPASTLLRVGKRNGPVGLAGSVTVAHCGQPTGKTLLFGG